MSADTLTKDEVSWLRRWWLGRQRAKWERRFKARIVERCMEHVTLDEIPENLDYEPWTLEQARSAATDEFEAVEFRDIYEGFESDPEGSADECMSYWSA